MILQQIQLVNDKLSSNNFTLELESFIPRTGDVTEYPIKKKSYIKIDEKKIEYIMPDLRNPLNEEMAENVALNYYDYQKKDKGVTLIAATFENHAKRKFTISILVTPFGDTTIYLSEGFYGSITYSGELR